MISNIPVSDEALNVYSEKYIYSKVKVFLWIFQYILLFTVGAILEQMQYIPNRISKYQIGLHMKLANVVLSHSQQQYGMQVMCIMSLALFVQEP